MVDLLIVDASQPFYASKSFIANGIAYSPGMVFPHKQFDSTKLALLLRTRKIHQKATLPGGKPVERTRPAVAQTFPTMTVAEVNSTYLEDSVTTKVQMPPEIEEIEMAKKAPAKPKADPKKAPAKKTTKKKGKKK